MSGRRSDQRKRFYDVLPALLPVLLSIALTQAVWVGIYDCKVTRSFFIIEYRNLTEDIRKQSDSSDVISVTVDKAVEEAEDIENTSIPMPVIVLVAGLMIIYLFGHFKRIVKSLLSFARAVFSFIIMGVIIQDAEVLLPVDKETQLAIGDAAIVVYAGFTVLAFFTKLLPERCHKLFAIINCSADAIYFLTWLPESTTRTLLATVVLRDMIGVIGPFGALREGKALRFSSTVAAPAPEGAAGDAVAEGGDDEAVVPEAGHIAAESDHQLPLVQCPELQDSSSSKDEGGDLAKREEDGEKTHNLEFEMGLGIFQCCSILVGCSMTAGALPALFTTVGMLVGIAYTLIRAMSNERQCVPGLAISIVFGSAGHYMGVALTDAIAYSYSNIFV